MANHDEMVRLMGLSAPETMPEAALDDEGVRGVDLAPTDDGLEAGIAAVFEAIRAREDDDAAEDADADETDFVPDDGGVTFALLTELNRLWERAPA
ncbi:MAG TPA: hypothetical protein VIN06_02200 [Devosia sp.]